MSIEVKSPRELELEALLRAWKHHAKEQQFNNTVLKESNASLQEYVGQLHGLKEVLRAEVTRLGEQVTILQTELNITPDNGRGFRHHTGK